MYQFEHLEMLKKYFPESKLNQIEVMIKDIVDSKRVNSTIRQIDGNSEV
jgi:hypothetical protein